VGQEQGLGRLADVSAKFEQLALAPGCSPAGNLLTHLADQTAGPARDNASSGLTAPNLPSPNQAKTLAIQATTVSGLTMTNVERQFAKGGIDKP